MSYSVLVLDSCGTVDPEPSQNISLQVGGELKLMLEALEENFQVI